FITNDYLNTEAFLTKTYNTLKNHKTKEKQLYYHIQVVYMIANTLFRNKKFETSIDYLQTMRQLMQSNQKKYDNTFKIKYNLLLALNFNYSNQQAKAIELLEKLKIPKHADLESLLD